MFSPRILAAFALVAAVTALPATEKPQPPQVITEFQDSDLWNDKPWFGFFGNFLAPLFSSFFPRTNQLKVDEKDNIFKVSLKVPQYAAKELKVKVKDCYLTIQGSHESQSNEHDVFSTSQFFQTLTLPANASADEATAELTSDGILVVTVPLNGADKNEGQERQVPVVETGKPDPQNKDTPVNESVDTTLAPVTEDDRKEPTTPASEPEIGDKENSIPHGEETKP